MAVLTGDMAVLTGDVTVLTGDVAAPHQLVLSTKPCNVITCINNPRGAFHIFQL